MEDKPQQGAEEALHNGEASRSAALSPAFPSYTSDGVVESNKADFALDLPQQPATARSMPQSADEDELPKSIPMAGDPSAEASKTHNPAMTRLGTLFVVGAVAANVFGFRYSRWAVGKELHRAWERYQARTSTSSRTSSSRASARASYERAAYEREAQARRAQREADAEARAAAHDRRARADKESRERTRAAYNAREAHYTWQAGVRIDFDPRMFEEMLKNARRGARSPFDVDQILDEMLRAARNQTNTGRANDFDSARFWEEIFGAQAQQGGSGTGAPGVFHRTGSSRHYATLGLQPGASETEIKAAYRKLVMQWHPDRYKGNDPQRAAQKFQEITHAYEALTKT